MSFYSWKYIKAIYFDNVILYLLRKLGNGTIFFITELPILAYDHLTQVNVYWYMNAHIYSQPCTKDGMTGKLQSWDTKECKDCFQKLKIQNNIKITIKI